MDFESVERSDIPAGAAPPNKFCLIIHLAAHPHSSAVVLLASLPPLTRAFRQHDHGTPRRFSSLAFNCAHEVQNSLRCAGGCAAEQGPVRIGRDGAAELSVSVG